MDRLWFHHCIQGFLSLAAIRTRDVHQFLDTHPYQSNIRLIDAYQHTETHEHPLTIQSAFHLPDRSVLYRQTKQPLQVVEHLDHANAPSGKELTMAAHPPSSLVELKPDHSAGKLMKLLPVYVRPQEDTVTEDEESDTGWKVLEERLQEELPGDETGEATMMEAGDTLPDTPLPATGRTSIFDRFDTRIQSSYTDDSEMRGVDRQREFVSWVTHLDDSREQTGMEPGKKKKKEEKKSGKKKNKSKKEAKRLAKLSVQKKRVVATETLAELLARQGHHQDAIDMYERLCLIYPEKKSIFAARIETIKSSRP